MSAEIYQFDIPPDGTPAITGQELPEGQTYADPGYGDGSGSDRIVTVFYGRTEIMSGETEIEDLSDGRQGISISATKHVRSLEAGQHCTEELVGPDGGRRILHIRNTDGQTPFPRHTHIFRALPGAVDAPDVGYTMGLN